MSINRLRVVITGASGGIGRALIRAMQPYIDLITTEFAGGRRLVPSQRKTDFNLRRHEGVRQAISRLRSIGHKVNELMENHRTSALGHGSLSRNIRLQLALPREERKKEGLKFVEECKATYDSLLEQCPAIPKKILMDFEKEYPFDGVFTKPEILDVRPIPHIKLPKTIEPIRAITKDTVFEKVGTFLSKDSEEYEEEEEDEEETDVEQGTQE